jgi:hypothetical protein
VSSNLTHANRGHLVPGGSDVRWGGCAESRQQFRGMELAQRKAPMTTMPVYVPFIADAPTGVPPSAGERCP